MKTLIITPSWIGDAIMSHTLYRLLLHNNPKIQIDVIATNWNQALFYRMPEIANVLPLKYFKHGSISLKKYYRFSIFLKEKKYQQSIILPNSFKSGLIPFFAGIPKRTGWKGEIRYGIINDIRTLHKKNFPLMIQRYAALAFEKQKIKSAEDLPNPLLLPYLQCTLEETKIILKKFNIKLHNKKNIGLCPGAEFSPSKCWPIYHYHTLALQLIYQGYQITLLGSYKEKILGEIIKNNLPKTSQIYCHNLIGLTSLDEAILIIKTCHLIVSNDSGLMHIACALKRPVVALYGPSNSNFTPPLYHYVKIMQLNTNQNYKKNIIKEAYYKNKYHIDLINIHPNEVLKEIITLLKHHEKN